MNCQQFIDEYKAIKEDDKKQEYLQNRIVNTYVNYQQKLADIENIVDVGNHVTIFDPDDPGKLTTKFKRNSPVMYLLLRRFLIQEYTDIELPEEGETGIEDINLLESEGLMDALIYCIPEIEVARYNDLLSMANNDIYMNERDIASFMESKISAMSFVLNTLLSQLDKIPGLNNELESDEK